MKGPVGIGPTLTMVRYVAVRGLEGYKLLSSRSGCCWADNGKNRKLSIKLLS